MQSIDLPPTIGRSNSFKEVLEKKRDGQIFSGQGTVLILETTQEPMEAVATADKKTLEVAEEVAGTPEGVASVKVSKKQGFLGRFGRKRKGDADPDQSATNSPTIKAGGPAVEGGGAALTAAVAEAKPVGKLAHQCPLIAPKSVCPTTAWICFPTMKEVGECNRHLPHA